jgi:quercetin dioxygenase-like cupin family protein
MTPDTFEAFKARKLSEGFDEVLVREWSAGLVLDTHSHPFEANALVVKGEFWLTVDGQTTHYQAGDVFQVGLGVPHSEKYGPEGAVFWAARRH